MLPATIYLSQEAPCLGHAFVRHAAALLESLLPEHLIDRTALDYLELFRIDELTRIFSLKTDASTESTLLLKGRDRDIGRYGYLRQINTNPNR